jgi:predicted AlkP superfamily phosphohydrolase/phosphomutase
VYPALALLAAFLIPALPARKRADPPVVSTNTATPHLAGLEKFPRMIVLGFDGLDPKVLARVIAKHPDRMKQFKQLVDEGGLHELGTTTPPQSPVAWSTFITGLDPGGHGIFDFIHRDPMTRAPAPSTTKEDAARTIALPAGWQFPLGGDSESNRTGKAFWRVLAEHGVPAFIWRMPANFPVEPAKGLSFSGMMTPAIDSAYGKCTFWTTDPEAASFGAGGRVVTVREFADQQLAGGGVIDTYLTGPDNAFKKDGAPVRIPLRIMVDRDAKAATLGIAGRTIVLQPGQWSDFVRVSFDMLPAGTASVHGIVRFHLRSLDPAVALYASPVNIDPVDPVAPVSAPASASRDVARAVGLYYTQGMPEDVNALKENILTDEEFMEQSTLVHDEGERMLEHALGRWLAEKDGGFLFFYFSGTDLCSHMMWRHADEGHPFHDAPFAKSASSQWSGRPGSTWNEVIEDVYLRMDPVIGAVRARMPADTTLMVISDHGFATFRRKFALNTWLLDHRYLVLKEGRTRELPRDDPRLEPVYIMDAVDWSKTRAYGVGFSGLYLNLQGREKDDPSTSADESGIVNPGAEADALVKEIKHALEAERDGARRPIVRCDVTADIYHGARLGEAPELIVGFDAGYGNSDESSLGRIPHDVLVDNDRAGTFNGNHLMAPEVVPGTLLSNQPVADGAHRLEDVTVEILRQYGIALEAGMRGHPVLQ